MGNQILKVNRIISKATSSIESASTKVTQANKILEKEIEKDLLSNAKDLAMIQELRDSIESRRSDIENKEKSIENNKVLIEKLNTLTVNQ